MLSVIFPVYKNTNLVEYCLSHLVERLPADAELILIDDASGPETVQLLRRFEKARLIEHEYNMGNTVAYNTGAAAAHGEVLVFVDSDVFVPTGALEQFSQVLVEHNRIGAVGSLLLYPYDNTIQHAGVAFDRWATSHLFVGRRRDEIDLRPMEDRQAVTAAFFACRRAVFEEVGGFDETYRDGMEDMEFCLRCRELGYRNVLLSSLPAMHLEGASRGPYKYVRRTYNRLDVNPFSGNVTSESVIEGFRRHPEAQAVVIMDWGGVPCDYPSISAECRLRETPLILDAAQSFGSLHEGKRYPHDIDYVCYSFGPTKLFSTVEGGAIAISERLNASHTRDLRWYGIRRESRDPWRFWEYHLEELGYRFVFNNVFAAIGLRILPLIDARLSHHRTLAKIYDDLLSGVPGLHSGKRLPESNPNFWLYTAVVDNRDQLITKLHSHGVHAATPHRRNDRMLEAWNEASAVSNLPGVDQFDQSYVCLPIGPWLEADDIEEVCGLIKTGW